MERRKKLNSFVVRDYFTHWASGLLRQVKRVRLGSHCKIVVKNSTLSCASSVLLMEVKRRLPICFMIF